MAMTSCNIRAVAHFCILLLLGIGGNGTPEEVPYGGTAIVHPVRRASWPDYVVQDGGLVLYIELMGDSWRLDAVKRQFTAATMAAKSRSGWLEHRDSILPAAAFSLVAFSASNVTELRGALSAKPSRESSDRVGEEDALRSLVDQRFGTGCNDGCTVLRLELQAAEGFYVQAKQQEVVQFQLTGDMTASNEVPRAHKQRALDITFTPVTPFLHRLQVSAGLDATTASERQILKHGYVNVTLQLASTWWVQTYGSFRRSCLDKMMSMWRPSYNSLWEFSDSHPSRGVDYYFISDRQLQLQLRARVTGYNVSTQVYVHCDCVRRLVKGHERDVASKTSWCHIESDRDAQSLLIVADLPAYVQMPITLWSFLCSAVGALIPLTVGTVSLRWFFGRKLTQ